MILVEPPPGWHQDSQSPSQNPETQKLSNLNLQKSAIGSSAATLPPANEVLNVNIDMPANENSLPNSAQSYETNVSACAKGARSDTTQISTSAPIELSDQIPSEILADKNVLSNAWPRWFWPGVGTAILIGILIFTVRFILHGGENALSNDAGAPARTPTIDANVAPSLEAKASHSLTESHLSPEETPSNQIAGKDPSSAIKSEAVQPDQNSDSLANITKTGVLTTPPPPNVEAVTTPHQAVTTASDGTKSTLQSTAAEASDKNVPPTISASDAVTSIPSDVSTERQINIGTLKRVPPKLANINVRLSDSFPSIEIQRQPLVDFLALISNTSTIPITIDAEALKELGQSAAAPVSLRLNDASISQILQTSLETLGLGYQICDGQLVVGYPPQEKLRQVRYVVADLVGGNNSSLDELASLIKKLIAPGSWQTNGGKATMVANNGVLLVEQTELAHAQILNFCERLRVARGLPLKSHYDPARFALTSREKQAQELLHKPISANFSQPQPLGEVINWLRHAIGTTILINHATLAQDGTSAESECTAQVVNAPLEKLLDELTSSADLCWRVIDGQTIEITTHQAALEHMDVEFYPVRDLAADNVHGASLIAQIRAEVEPKLWNNGTNSQSNKNLADKAMIYFDTPSSTFIVRAPQRLQAAVEAALTIARDKK